VSWSATVLRSFWRLATWKLETPTLISVVKLRAYVQRAEPDVAVVVLLVAAGCVVEIVGVTAVDVVRAGKVPSAVVPKVAVTPRLPYSCCEYAFVRYCVISRMSEGDSICPASACSVAFTCEDSSACACGGADTVAVATSAANATHEPIFLKFILYRAIL
jgi:hypothetical protein